MKWTDGSHGAHKGVLLTHLLVTFIFKNLAFLEFLLLLLLLLLSAAAVVLHPGMSSRVLLLL